MRPVRAVLQPDPFGHTWRGKLYFGTMDARRVLARYWKCTAAAIYEWIWP